MSLSLKTGELVRVPRTTQKTLAYLVFTQKAEHMTRKFWPRSMAITGSNTKIGTPTIAWVETPERRAISLVSHPWL